MSEDYYKILGVSRTATPEQIQKAYRSLARKHHPDLNPEDPKSKDRFKKVQQAFDVLDDPKKRELYDRFGPEFESYRAAGGAEGQPFSDIDVSQIFGRGGGGGMGSFEEILRQFGSGGGARTRRRPAQTRGQDVEHQITIPFATAVLGGELQTQLSGPDGGIQTVNVKIPAGIADGKRLRLRGKGAPGAPAGDLYIRIRIAPHPVFTRQGDNLELKLPISVSEALLGAKVDVPTPYGEITVTIAPASSSGKRLRIKGFGVTRPDGQRGDLYVELQIVSPAHLNDQGARLVRELDQVCPTIPRRGIAW